MAGEWRPSLAGSPARPGFGSRLAEISVLRSWERQITWTWAVSGLVVTIYLHPSRLARGEIAEA